MCAKANVGDAGAESIAAAAMRVGNFDSLSLLLDAKLNPNATDPSQPGLLWYAARHSYVEGLQLLMKAKADVNRREPFGDLNPAALCDPRDKQALLSKILSSNFDPNKFMNDPESAMKDVDSEMISIMQQMIGGMPSVIPDAPWQNDVSSDASTPLFVAVYSGNISSVSILINAKADVNTPNGDQTTPIYVAALQPSPDIFLQLLEVKAEPGKCYVQNREVTPFVAAAKAGSVAAVKSLLRLKADGVSQSQQLLSSDVSLSPTITLILKESAELQLKRKRQP